MIPLLDEDFKIHGTQIFIKYETGVRKVFNLRNFTTKEKDVTFCNKQTKSGYKIYNKGLFYEFILVEAKLSKQLRHQKDFFNNFEKDSILTN